MNENKKNSRYLLGLLILFLSIFSIKLVLSFLMNGTFIYIDEFCILQKGKYFIETFRLISCTDIIGTSASNPFPLYPILISPIYLFFNGFNAYYAILILNSLIIASLVFPLYKIIKHFINKDWLIYIFISIILFSASIFTLEKTVMTGTIFLVVGIWFIYFYLLSFIENKKRNKIISIILSILAIFTRPYGFIIPLSLIINELVLAKKKKRLILILSTLLFLSGIGFFVFSYIYFPEHDLSLKISNLMSPEGIKLFILAVKNQLINFILPLFFVVPIIFISFNFKKNLNDYKYIKYFLISFIILNFLISAQHMFGYYVGAAGSSPSPLNFLTRYINLSLTYILLFSFIFIYKFGKFKLNSRNIIISTILLIPLLTLQFTSMKYALSLDIEIYKFLSTNIKTIILFLFLFSILLLNKKHLISLLIAILILINSLLSFQRVYLTSNGNTKDFFTYFFERSNQNILFENQFFINEENPELKYHTLYWSLKLFSQNNIDMVNDINEVEDIEKYDYIIDPQGTSFELPYKLILTTEYERVFQKI